MVRVVGRQAKADRNAVVLHEDGVLRQAEQLREFIDDPSEVVDGVSELVPRASSCGRS
jgi:hypothetical protein